MSLQLNLLRDMLENTSWRSIAITVSVGSIGAALTYAVATAFRPSPAITSEQIRADGGNPLPLKSNPMLEYFIHGDPNGKTVLLAIHGAQTTGKLFSLLSKWAENSNIKIVAPTLPGFGLSSFSQDYTLEDWVGDMQQLMDHLKVTQFHVLGTSLGSIHAAALACLYKPQKAVLNVELYVAFAPLVSGEHDPLEGSVLNVFAKMRRFPLLKRLFEKTIVLPLMRLFLPREGDVARSVRNQWEGIADCARCIYQPWRFDWEKMAQGRRVIIVSGRQDNAAPPHNQQWLHKYITGSELVEFDGTHEQPLKDISMMSSHVDLLIKSNLKL